MSYAKSRHALVTAALAGAACIEGCNSGSEPANTLVPESEISQPTVINLYPDNSTADVLPRLFLPIVSLGTNTLPLPQPVALDTGSAGMTFYAPAAFPSNMVTPCLTDSEPVCGFVFPTGQSTLTYEGITVTDRQAYRCYGASLGRTEIGNLGYAQVTFGDSAGTLTTAVMPILFYYKVTKNVAKCNDGTEVVTTSQPQQGWFGIDPHADLTYVVGASATSTSPICSPDATGNCFEVSALKYLHYGIGVNPGFALSPGTLSTTCSIATWTDCPPKPMLTVGVTAAMLEAFTTQQLSCTPDALGDGFPVCNPTAQKVGLSVTTSSGAMVTLPAASALFDTGTPDINVVASASALASLPTTTTQTPGQCPIQSELETILRSDTPVTFAIPGGGTYSYSATCMGTTETIVNPGGIPQDIIGIDYFQGNSFLIDLLTGVEGWMSGSGS
jgi:hypothetical protein